ncbi:MAG: hypothetical protein CM15mP86_07460 [Gammaproteobacteria bacterium]|nr:MAG: hypothetical protein CM15mP86_07460 [Gammaproteobacteria bacterium]
MVIGGENEDAETLLSWGFYDEICPGRRTVNQSKRNGLSYMHPNHLLPLK